MVLTAELDLRSVRSVFTLVIRGGVPHFDDAIAACRYNVRYCLLVSLHRYKISCDERATRY